jgi:ABC-2 type transport system permease protein
MYKGPRVLGDLFYWPLVDILLWGLTSVWILSQHHVENLPLILMTGLIFWQVTWRGGIDVPVSLLQEFWCRNLVNLFSTPLKISEWCAGILLLCLVKLLITIAFGVGVVYLLYSLNVFQLGWAFLPFALSLMVFGWFIGFLTASVIIYWGQQMETLAWMTVWIFAPFSAVFFPVTTLPVWAHPIAWSLPTTYIFEGMRQILAGGSFPMRDFWVSMALNAIYLSGSIFLFKFCFEKSRVKGLARLE